MHLSTSITPIFLFTLILCSACTNAFQNPTSSAVRRGNGLVRSTSFGLSTVMGLSMVMDIDGGGLLPEAIANAWTSYNVALEQDPLITKSITASVILGAADLTGQAIERNINNEALEQSGAVSVDLARAGRFALFGLVLQAPWNHFYYQFLDGALPPTDDPLTFTTGIKVVIDQFLQAPIFTVIIFYFLGLLEGKTLEGVGAQLEKDYKDTMLANWKLWVPATAVNIAFCPPILRVLFLNCVFFFWSIFLSLKLNSNEE